MSVQAKISSQKCKPSSFWEILKKSPCYGFNIFILRFGLQKVWLRLSFGDSRVQGYVSPWIEGVINGWKNVLRFGFEGRPPSKRDGCCVIQVCLPLTLCTEINSNVKLTSRKLLSQPIGS